MWGLLALLILGTPAVAGPNGNNSDGDLVAGTGLSLSKSYPYLYNGTSFDRWRGDATNGAWVFVKSSVLPPGAALDSSLTTLGADLGAPGATACASDTASCNANQLYQRIAQRLSSILGALGSPLQAGGNVSVTSLPTLPAGTNGIGNVGGKTNSVCVTPTVTASNAYGTNYVVGGLLTFSNAFTATGTGIVQSVAVTVKKVETSGFTLFLFNSNPSNTTWTDAAVAAINAADVAAVREPITLTANSQLGTHTILSAVGIGQAMAPGATLYGVLLANAALTNQFAAASDLQVCVKTLPDL